MLVAVQMPFSDAVWHALGAHSTSVDLLLANGVGLKRGPRAWAWKPDSAASASAERCSEASDARRVALGLDHVVLLVPDVAALLCESKPGPVRRDVVVNGRRTCFFVYGEAVVEVIEEKSVSRPLLYGVCLYAEDVSAVAESWRAMGLEVGAVHPAKQGEGREICSVKRAGATSSVGLALITRRRKRESKL